jgi:hypothetical protein
MAGLLLLVGGWGLSAPVPKGSPPTSTKAPAKADVRKSSPKAQLAAALIQSRKQAPIPHKPWKMAHPETGKEVQPEEMLPKLPNGKQVQAKDYFDQLNRMEKHFNGLGHSTRDTAKKVLLQETKVDKNRLNTQSRTLAAKHRPFDPKTMRRPTPHKDLPAAHQAAVKQASSQAAAPAAKGGGGKTKPAKAVAGKTNPAPAGGGKTKASTGAGGKTAPAPASGGKTTPATAGGGNTKGDRELKTFSFTAGDNKTVSVFLDGQWEMNVSSDAVDLKGEAHAGAYLLNNRIEVLTATAALHAGGGANGSAKLTVSVLGQVVHNPNLPIKTTWNKRDQVSKTVDHSVPFSFTIGPIPLSVKIGARGSVGVNYFFGVSALPLYATAQVVPNASLDAYAQAGLDIKIASAGVVVNLQLLRVKLTLGAEAGLKNDNQGTNLYLFVHGDNELTLLNGSLSFYAEVYVPAFKLPPWEKKHFEHNFFKWTGLKGQGSLFSVERRTPLPGAAAKGTAPAPAKGTAPAPAKGTAPAPAKATPKASPSR